MTDSTRHERISKLFLEVRSLSSESRQTRLEQLCADDPSLIAEVLSLMTETLPDEFIETPVLGESFVVPMEAEASSGPIPERIESFKVLGVLGEGGMGIVYRALQDHPEREVALKVVRSGMSSEKMLRRFEYEAQMLARLHHPGIAQIYATGTFSSGSMKLPYFAMELITGRSLTDYVTADQSTLSERLNLVAHICDAAQHAHQRGVIHRDLKPANILVDESGQPKILDFGVAKATDSDLQRATLQTNTGQVLGTVAYMSPEQVEGNPDEIDTGSDIYSIGVILYELLAGQLPLDIRNRSLPEAARIIADEEPSRLSSHNRSFRGDLETIVGKALEKDKSRRYASAAELGDDIRRYLSHETIRARPASTWYQLQKFTRRNQILVGGVAAVMFVLTAGIIGTSWGLAQAVEARNLAQRNETRAQAELAKSEQYSTFTRGILEGVDPQVAQGRDTKLLRALLDDAAGRIGAELQGQAEAEILIRNTMGSSYTAIAAYEQADAQLTRAHELALGELGERHPITFDTCDNLGWLRLAQSRTEDAENLFERNVQRRTEVMGEDHPGTFASRIGLLQTLNDKGSPLDARAMGIEIVESSRRVLGDDHPSTIFAISSVARANNTLRRYDEAEPLYLEALGHQRRWWGDQDPRTLNTIRGLASVYRQMGQLENAEPLYQEVLEARRVLYGDEHPQLADAMNSLALLYRDMQRFDDAERLYRQALDILRPVLGEAHQNSLMTMSNLAAVLMSLGNNVEAESLMRQRVDICAEHIGPSDPRTLQATLNLAVFLDYSNQRDRAVPIFEQMISTTRELNLESAFYLSSYLIKFSQCLFRLERLADAETALLEAVELLIGEDDITIRLQRDAMLTLGYVYEKMGRPEEAKRWFERAP